MGFLSCNAESAIATCDSHYWDLKKKNINPDKQNNKLFKIREFHFSELLAATGNFSANTFLGKGSHGSVYKATLDDGKLIAAVKKTKSSKTNHHRNNNNNHHAMIASCTSTTPAENEIEILSHVQNQKRFVNLIGFSTDANGNNLLVVEYMPNGSLHDALHSSLKPPGWNQRLRFALQVAKSVHALHSANPPVIHRDIKSSNILIDEEKRARLGDFGLALRGHVEDVRVKCTPPAGTMGYLDPSYLAPGDVSAKSDVFSFGILLLEIVSGRNAIDLNYSPPSVVDWAVPMIKRGEFGGICDRRIGRPGMGVVREVGLLAARCVRSTAEKRPTMEEVVERLERVRKRVEVRLVWRGLRRRGEDLKEEEEMVGRVVMMRGGSRRNGKVSSVEKEVSEGCGNINEVGRTRSMPEGNVVRRRMNRSRSRSRSISMEDFNLPTSLGHVIDMSKE